MICPNCNYNVESGNFCPQCGCNMSNVNNNYPNQYNNNDDNYDDNLLRAFINTNADKILSKKWNWSCFFFTPAYFFYRKMWLYGFAWLLATALIMALFPKLLPLMTLILLCVLSVKFSEIYIDFAKKKIQKIKAENPNASYEQLMNICAQKGGTTIWPVVVYVIISVILIAITIALYLLFWQAIVEMIAEITG